MNFKLNRSVARALQSEYPVGDAFSGPVYANQRWAARLPGHRDFIGDIVEGVVDTVGDVVESVVESPIGQMVVTAAAFYFGGPLGAALAQGGMALMNGADPMEALLRGGLTYLGGSMLQGAGIGGSAAGAADSVAGQAAGSTIAEGAAGSVAGEAAVADSLASQVAGTATDPAKFLTASVNTNPGVMSDVAPGLLESATATAPPVAAAVPAGAVDSMGVFPGEVAGQWGGPTGFPVQTASGDGIINSVLEFSRKNPAMALTAGQGVTSIIGGIGQAGLEEKKIQAEKEMQAQKLADQQALDMWRRRFTQEGSVGAGTIPFSPAADQTLRRPDGTPVHAQPGIILGQMQR